jgi:site-specific recombinase
MSEVHLTPEELEAQIEVQREHLAETVDQLAHKLDVKAQVKTRIDTLRSRVSPAAVAGFVGAAALVGALVWWRKTR